MANDDGTEIIGQLIEGFDPGSFVTKFVVVAEVIDADGQRQLWVETDRESERWDRYGLLKYALEDEEIDHHRLVVKSED